MGKIMHIGGYSFSSWWYSKSNQLFT